MAATRANKNRQIRQEALREQLAEQCRVQHIVDNINKLETQGSHMETNEIQATKAAIDARLRLLNKYLPDLKSQEVTGEGGGPVLAFDLTSLSDEELKALVDSEGA